MNRLIASLIVIVSLMASSVWALPDETVNINTASAEEIANVLDGVGPSRAAAIVEYREQFGDFATVEELTAVSGIGIKVLDSNRDKILLQR